MYIFNVFAIDSNQKLNENQRSCKPIEKKVPFSVSFCIHSFNLSLTNSLPGLNQHSKQMVSIFNKFVWSLPHKANRFYGRFYVYSFDLWRMIIDFIPNFRLWKLVFSGFVGVAINLLMRHQNMRKLNEIT